MKKQKKLPKAILLMGPTAAGKTAVAIELAKKYPLEIISVDSALIYKGMDIGTGKPSEQTLSAIPHFLINICEPTQAYSAAQFREQALKHMEEIIDRGNIPLLVGGTMLYFKALLEGLADLPQADEKMRAQIEAQAKQKGWPVLHAQLAQIDPKSAAQIHPNDSQRIQRALEIFALTGEPLSVAQARQTPDNLSSKYELFSFGLGLDDRAELHKNIEKRFDQMLQSGFVEEVKKLQQQYKLNLDLPSMRSVGYRQVWQHLQGQFDRAQLREKGVAATRQLAKRQLTWLKKWPDLIQLSKDQNVLDFLPFLK
jgi:tRNA dimethylallyltransferase